MFASRMMLANKHNKLVSTTGNNPGVSRVLNNIMTQRFTPYYRNVASLSTTTRKISSSERTESPPIQRKMKQLLYASTIRALDAFHPSLYQPHCVVYHAGFSDERKPREGSPTSSQTSSFSTSTSPSSENTVKKVQDAVKNASLAAKDFLVRLPGWIWFYMTHPKETRARLVELWEATQKEAHHYWMGSKLLYADVQTASNLVYRLIQGSGLTRRERKQLLRTVSDLFRLVPFSMFILIPFMEFALPIALRVFPNMLPSTFQDSLKAEENMKRELKSRIVMAQFFQETLQEMAKEQKKRAANRKEKVLSSLEEESPDKVEIVKKQEQSAASMLEFLEKARNGEMVPPEVIIQFATLFQDDLTLDNMPRMQLINMCKYMAIPPYGSDALLRFQLRHKIRVIKEDDQRILWEGIGSLTKMELREACQERGMRSTGLSKDAYKLALQQWLDLSVDKNVPISLLIMSRTFFLHDEMTARVSSEDHGSKSVTSLADAISGLDKDVVNEVVLEIATPEEAQSDPSVRRIRLEVLEAQNELILQEKLEREATSKKKEQQEQEAAAVAAVVSAEPEETTTNTSTTPESTPLATADPAIDPVTTTATEEPQPQQVAAAAPVEEEKPEEEEKREEEEELSSQEIDAISQLLHPDPVNTEREELARIKAAIESHAETEEETPEQEEDASSSEAVEKVEEKTIVDVDVDKAAAETIAKMDAALEEEAQKATTTDVEAEDKEEEGGEEEDDHLAGTIARLKKRVAKMVDRIETQLEHVQGRIGDKLHFLDKDNDGILTREEMADALQQVLKRELTFEEAMDIAALMDENQDGVFTVGEFTEWIETNKILRLVKEGRDADLDRIIEKQSQKDESKEEQTTVVSEK